MALGTVWVAPGQGAKLETLATLLAKHTGDPPILTDHPKEASDLRFTGGPLQPYDFDRMRAALENDRRDNLCKEAYHSTR